MHVIVYACIHICSLYVFVTIDICAHTVYKCYDLQIFVDKESGEEMPVSVY